MGDLVHSLFDLSGVNPRFIDFFGDRMPWKWLDGLTEFLTAYKTASPFVCARVDALKTCEYYDETGGPILIEEGARIQSGAILKGPIYIGKKVTISYGAVVRDECIIMDDCRVGHVSEIKGSILLPGAVSGHRNYIGDSVVGRSVNFGDGSGIANLRADRDPTVTVKVTWNGERIDTKRRKFGALVGDNSSIGCRATLCPGTILGMDVLVYPNQLVVGTVPENHEVVPPQRAVIRQRNR